jgi:hypothetical protein
MWNKKGMKKRINTYSPRGVVEKVGFNPLTPQGGNYNYLFINKSP